MPSRSKEKTSKEARENNLITYTVTTERYWLTRYKTVGNQRQGDATCPVRRGKPIQTVLYKAGLVFKYKGTEENTKINKDGESSLPKICLIRNPEKAFQAENNDTGQ